MNLSFDGGVTDDGADVVERRPYDAGACPERSRGGACTVLDADGSDDSDNASDVGNPFLFTGRRLDSEWAGMQYRNRSYSTTLGRFVSRDSAYREAYHLYVYAASSPLGSADPVGLDRVVLMVYVPELQEDPDGLLPGPTPFNLTAGAKAEFERILQDAVARGVRKQADGTPCHTVEVMWQPTDATYNQWSGDAYEGVRGYHSVGRGTRTIGVYIQARAAGPRAGVGRPLDDWAVSFRPQPAATVARDRGHTNNNVTGAALAHEILFHLVGDDWHWPALFSKSQQYVDSPRVNTTGSGVWSGDAVNSICNGLGITGE
jgi:RHS repeat-associated protein